jgi:hypothetical protein
MEYERIQELKELKSLRQRGPYRDITWIKFDEQYTDWKDFLRVLDRHLKAVKSAEAILGGLFFEHDLREGCVTEVYKHLRERFPVQVMPDLVGCVGDFYQEGEDLPGGYTRGSNR